MINLRYHVFSLVAVFAALAIGIVLGSTTVKSGLVDSLRSNVESAEEHSAEVEAENAELRARNEQLDMLAAEGAPLVDDELVGEPVLWIEAPGVDGAVVDGLQRAFDASGAQTVGRIAVEDVVADPDAVETVAAALGSESGDLTDLQSDLAATVADRVMAAARFSETPVPSPTTTAVTTTTIPTTTTTTTTTPTTSTSTDSAPDRTTTTPPPDGEASVPAADASVPSGTSPTTEPPGTTTLPVTTTTTLPPDPVGPRVDAMLRAQLGELEDTGLIDLSDLESDPLPPGSVMRIVVVVDQRSGLDVAGVMIPLLDRLTSAEEPMVVVLAEASVPSGEEDAPDSVVQTVRGSGRLRDEMTTVDNAEDFPGWAASVLGVRNSIVDERGHYGYREGSDSLLPPPVS